MGNLNTTAIKINRVLDKEFLNVEFWKSETQIMNYAEGILKYVDPTHAKTINVSFGSSAMCSDTREAWNIVIPTFPPTIALTEIEIEKLIYARAVFLRHELAHALFTKPETDMSKRACHDFVNAIDDARIEKLFGDKFLGARRGFRDLVTTFYKNSKSYVETSKMSLEVFKSFARFYLSGFQFDETKPNIQKYLELINSEDIEKFYTLDKNAYKEFADGFYLKAKEYFHELDKTPEPQIEDEDGEDEIPETPSQSENDEEQEDENSDNESDENSDETSEDEESEAEEAEDGEDSEVEVEESEDEESSSTSENSDEDSNEDEDEEDTSSPEKSEDAEDAEESDEEQDKAELNEENDQEISGQPTSELKEDNRTEKLFSESKDYDDLINFKVESAVDYKDMLDYKFNVRDFEQALILDLTNACEVLNGISLKRDYKASYNQTVLKYRKTIAETMQFLARKLQNRTRIKQLDNQLEGDLNQKNLTDIFTNPDFPRAFFKNIKIDKTDNTLHILIDGSGSMGQHAFSLAITNAIILFEICRKMNINIGIYVFGSNQHRYKVKKGKTVSKQMLNKIFPVHSANFDVHTYGDGNQEIKLNGNKRLDGGCLFVVKNPKDKIREFHKKILCSLLNNKPNLIGGSTPEFTSLLALVKNYNCQGRNLLFLLNDGGYDTGFVRADIKNVVSLYADYIQGSTVEELIINIDIVKSDLTDILNQSDVIKKIADHLNWRNKDAKLTIDEPKIMINNLINHLSATQANLKKNIFTTKSQFYKSSTDRSSEMMNMRIETDGNYDTLEYQVLSNCSSVGHTKYDINRIVYANAIKFYKDQLHWSIFGIGIQSDVGQKYIGKENFLVVRNAEDLEKNFSKKLREIY